MEFNPPIHERDVDELIKIVFASKDEWNAEAKEQACLELSKKKILFEEQKKRFVEIDPIHEQEIEQEVRRRGVLDFSLLDKIEMIAVWPRELLSNRQLKREGFLFKAKQRWKFIGIGVIVWLIFFGALAVYLEKEQERRSNEMEMSEPGTMEKADTAQ
jgi:hypothetical protein